jgi:hypothetical protein
VITVKPWAKGVPGGDLLRPVEEGHLRLGAAVPKLLHPVGGGEGHRGAPTPSYDDLVNTGKVEARERFQEEVERQKADRGRRVANGVGSRVQRSSSMEVPSPMFRSGVVALVTSRAATVRAVRAPSAPSGRRPCISQVYQWGLAGVSG